MTVTYAMGSDAATFVASRLATASRYQGPQFIEDKSDGTALDRDDQRPLIAEAEPRSAIGQSVGVHRAGGIERLTHSAADGVIPFLWSERFRGPAARAPKPQFLDIVVAAVAA